MPVSKIGFCLGGILKVWVLPKKLAHGKCRNMLFSMSCTVTLEYIKDKLEVLGCIKFTSLYDSLH